MKSKKTSSKETGEKNIKDVEEQKQETVNDSYSELRGLMQEDAQLNLRNYSMQPAFVSNPNGSVVVTGFGNVPKVIVAVCVMWSLTAVGYWQKKLQKTLIVTDNMTAGGAEDGYILHGVISAADKTTTITGVNRGKISMTSNHSYPIILFIFS